MAPIRAIARPIRLVVALAVASAGCGGTDTVPSATAGAAVVAGSSTTLEPIRTTTTTTSTADAAQPTTEPTTEPTTQPTTEPTTPAAVTTAPSPPTTRPAGPTTPAPSTAVAVVDSALVEIDVASGDVTRTIDEYFAGDGIFRYGLQRSPDGSTLWFGEAYEDGWYSCESSVGAVGSVDLETGALSPPIPGGSPASAPDGGSLAYTASDVCIPDPEAPEFWVLTPADRVIVRTLATGTETAVVSRPAPDAYDAPTAVEWVGFDGADALLVRTADGSIRRVDPTGSATLQDHPIVTDSLPGVPIGTGPDRIVTVDLGDEGSTDVYAVDPATGTATPLASSESFMAIGVGDGGHVVVASSTPVTVHADGLVTVLTVAGGAFVAELDW